MKEKDWKFYKPENWEIRIYTQGNLGTTSQKNITKGERVHSLQFHFDCKKIIERTEDVRVTQNARISDVYNKTLIEKYLKCLPEQYGGKFICKKIQIENKNPGTKEKEFSDISHTHTHAHTLSN